MRRTLFASPAILLAIILNMQMPLYPQQISASGIVDPITPAQMAQIWDDLASEDTKTAHEAIAILVASGDQGTQLLDAYVDSIRAYADPAQIRRLVWDMSRDESGTSRQDFEALTRLGRLAEQPLRDALTKATSEQNRSRIEQCLAACTKSFSESPQTRRLTRVMWTLQLIETDQAHQVLKRLGIPEQPLQVWKAVGTAKIQPLTGQNHVAANQARNKADLLQAEYSSEYRPGPPKDIKAWAKVILEYKDAIEKFPVTEVAAYCRVRLSGFYQYTNDNDRKIRELAQVGRIFEGTNHQAKVYIEIGLTYLQGHHNPAKAVPWFEAVPDILKLPSPEEAATDDEKEHAAALQLKWKTVVSQNLVRCKEELASRAEADNAPWPQAVKGIQCRLRPVKLTFPNGRLPRFRIDAQNIGNHNLWLTEGGNVTEVQVDGQWYTRPKRSLRDPLHWFGPDCQYYDDGMALGKYWRTKETDQPIDLKPGWHTVRAAYIAQSGGVHNTEPFRIESNAVQIEILP
jgi:hypothetical protein